MRGIRSVWSSSSQTWSVPVCPDSSQDQLPRQSRRSKIALCHILTSIPRWTKKSSPRRAPFSLLQSIAMPSSRTPVLHRASSHMMKVCATLLSIGSVQTDNAHPTATSGGMGRHLGVFSCTMLMYVFCRLICCRFLLTDNVV